MSTASQHFVEIVARINNNTASPEIAYFLAPNAPPERMSHLSVIASDLGGGRIAGVVAEITPERGTRHTCITGSTGFCATWEFWPNLIEVTGTKEGYQPAQANAMQEFGSDSLYLRADLTMRREP